jgi:hypothetical protein
VLHVRQKDGPPRNKTTASGLCDFWKCSNYVGQLFSMGKRNEVAIRGRLL